MAFDDYIFEDSFDDLADDLADPNYYGDQDDFEPYQRRKHCDRCGTTGLHWEQTDNGWRLFNGLGTMHTCVNVNDALDLLPDLDEEEKIEQPPYKGYTEIAAPKLEIKSTDVICPYCGGKAKWVSGRTIYPNRPELFAATYYHCAPCKAYVGCHKGTPRPLGTLADAELRRLRLEAHMAFDPIWKDSNVTRTAAYKWLSNQLGITPDECHIGKFDLRMCERAIAVCMNANIERCLYDSDF
jgi:hypothetical protein